jgi:hypothetical protein
LDEAMIKPILYQSIEEKNQLERQMFKALTPEQALIRALDVMDLMLQLERASGRERKKEDDIDWIVLTPKKIISTY